MILLVVDTQKLITTTKLYQFELFESRVKELMVLKFMMSSNLLVEN